MDETASCEKNGDRKWVWAERGLPGFVARHLKKATRWSVLPGYTLDQGYVAPILVEGGVTKEIFLWWLKEKLLPALNIRPGYHDIIIMDNCAIHKNPEVLQAIRDAGAEPHFLPPYCPIYNPIEQTFNVLKTYLRREYIKQMANYPDFKAFLVFAVNECGTGPAARKRAKAHFRHSGYCNEDNNEEV